MKPGRKLDELVAEKVMGWVKCAQYIPIRWAHKDWPAEAQTSESVPSYSTDIAAAWQVVEKVGTVNLSGPIFNKKMKINVYRANFNTPNTLFTNRYPTVVANTAPHAICLAALASLGILTKEGEKK